MIVVCFGFNPRMNAWPVKKGIKTDSIIYDSSLFWEWMHDLLKKGLRQIKLNWLYVYFENECMTC